MPSRCIFSFNVRRGMESRSITAPMLPPVSVRQRSIRARSKAAMCCAARHVPTNFALECLGFTKLLFTARYVREPFSADYFDSIGRFLPRPLMRMARVLLNLEENAMTSAITAPALTRLQLQFRKERDRPRPSDGVET